MKISKAILMLAERMYKSGDAELSPEVSQLVEALGEKKPIDNTETLKQNAYSEGANYAKLAPNGDLSHNPYTTSNQPGLSEEWVKGFDSVRDEG